MTQSKTYNGGKVVEYTYNHVTEGQATVLITIWVDTVNDLTYFEKPNNLSLDIGSENAFLGICCPIDCEGWITEDELCWVTEGGLSWAV